MRFGFGFGFGFGIDRPPFGIDPRSLFAAGEQGFWYDPSDFSTLFQDAAGTTPVTALSQPCGLMLDKSKGPVLGPEIVSNGGFDTDTVWVKGTGWSIGSGKASFDPTGQAANSDIYAALSSSKDSAQTADISANGAFTVYLAITAGGGHVKVTGEVSGRTAGTIRVLAASGRVYIRALNGTGFNGSIDNISVRELPGNHAYQTTALSRPTVEARVNLLTKTSLPAEWTYINSPTVTLGVADPFGGTAAVTITDDDDLTSRYVRPSVVTLAGESISRQLSVYVKQQAGDAPALIRANHYAGTPLDARVCINTTTGAVAAVSDCTATTSQHIAPNGDIWWKVTLVAVSTANTSVAVSLYAGAVLGSTSIASTHVGTNTYAFPQLAFSSDPMRDVYQPVNTATDYVDVGAPRYLSFDGTDDGMVTPSIDFTGTDKMTVWAGVRKNSDAVAAAFVELSASANTNNGAFVLFAPLAAGNIVMRHRGASAFIDATAATYTAPITAVVSATSVLGTGAVGVNANKTPFTNTGVTGGGNYGNYPLYIGRRGGTTLPFNGHIYQLIGRGAATPLAQIVATEQYVNAKTGAF